jgi:putative ABC transport system permease protein
LVRVLRGLWQRYFAADRAIVGRHIRLNGEQYTVVGVMPPNFSPHEYGELWLTSPWGVRTHPLAPDKDPCQFRDRSYLDVWARLKPGVTVHQARAELDTIGRRLERQYRDSNGEVGVSFLSLDEHIVGDIRPVLLVLLAAVVIVLLIECANVANLLLARATARAKEISIRTALGASRRRLLRQLLSESVLLALVGGLLGLLLAVLAVPSLLALSPPDIRQFKQIGINREVLAFSFLTSVVCGVLFGLIPALQSSRSHPNEFLKEGERGSTANRGRIRSALVIAEVGLSLVLLVGAGLLVKSFARLMDVNAGFDPGPSLDLQPWTSLLHRSCSPTRVLPTSCATASGIARRAGCRCCQQAAAGWRQQFTQLQRSRNRKGLRSGHSRQHS